MAKTRTKASASKAERCPTCGQPATLRMGPREVRIGPRRVVVNDERYHCAACGEEDFYTPAQARALHERALAAIREQEQLLRPDQIRAIREGLGLTQEQFERLLGVGAKTVVRWETGRVLPNTSTDRLIRLVAASRENVHILAGINGILLDDARAVAPAVA